MTHGLKDAHREAIIAVLKDNDRVERAVLFGSRATGTNTAASDVDIALFGERLTLTDRARLSAALDEIPMAQTVDLILYGTTENRAVREHIRREGIEWYASTAAEHDQFQPTRRGRDSTVSGRWPNVPLNELIDLTLSSVDKKTKVNETEVRLCNYLDVYNNSFVHADMEFMSATATQREIARCALKKGDVVLTKDSEQHDDIGVPALVRDDVQDLICAYHLAILRPRASRVFGPYLFYALSNPATQRQFHAFANGITRFGLRKYDIGLVEIPLPPVATQRAVAQILAELDEKIELTRRMNAALEMTARALFKSWFVHFDPVRAKAEGRDTGWPQGIADAFPEGLVGSEMGQVPQGWKVSKIGREVKAIGGSTPSTKEPAYWYGGQHYWATPKDLSQLSSPVLLDTNRKITQEGVQRISSGTLPVGTVLLSSRAPIGYLAIAEVPTAVNQGFIAMKCEQRLPNLYVLFWCHENLGHIRDIAGGSTFPEISKRVFRSVPVLVPSKEVLVMYQRLAAPLYRRIVTHMREALTLAALRGALLPKLVSGEIRVRDAKRLVESVP